MVAQATNFEDFDKAFAEIEGEPFPFRFLGRMWELPVDVDAAVVLRIERLMIQVAQISRSGEVPDDLVISDDLSYEKILRSLVGDEIVDQWLELGCGYRAMQFASRRIFAHYQGQKGQGQEDPTPPNRATRRQAARKKPSSAPGKSSNDGRSSRRTSPASTEST